MNTLRFPVRAPLGHFSAVLVALAVGCGPLEDGEEALEAEQIGVSQSALTHFGLFGSAKTLDADGTYRKNGSSREVDLPYFYDWLVNNDYIASFNHPNDANGYNFNGLDHLGAPGAAVRHSRSGPQHRAGRRPDHPDRGP